MPRRRVVGAPTRLRPRGSDQPMSVPFVPNPAAIEWAERHGLDPNTILPDLTVTRARPGDPARFRVEYVRVVPDETGGTRRETCILHTDEEPPPTLLLPKPTDWRARAL